MFFYPRKPLFVNQTSGGLSMFNCQLSRIWLWFDDGNWLEKPHRKSGFTNESNDLINKEKDWEPNAVKHTIFVPSIFEIFRSFRRIWDARTACCKDCLLWWNPWFKSTVLKMVQLPGGERRRWKPGAQVPCPSCVWATQASTFSTSIPNWKDGNDSCVHYVDDADTQISFFFKRVCMYVDVYWCIDTRIYASSMCVYIYI